MEEGEAFKIICQDTGSDSVSGLSCAHFKNIVPDWGRQVWNSPVGFIECGKLNSV